MGRSLSRLLGAYSLDIDYIGFDTNTSLEHWYTNMQAYLSSFTYGRRNHKQVVDFQDCMGVDFSKIDYDFVFTSPPYENLELYEGMAPWKSEADFYAWLIALIQKCRDNIVPTGSVCFNISIPYIYVREAHSEVWVSILPPQVPIL